jgi:hypothetical protein
LILKLEGDGLSTYKEMPHKKRHSGQQQDVNEATGYVKREQTEQPENDQCRANDSEHFRSPMHPT